jgi:hypothetical protein
MSSRSPQQVTGADADAVLLASPHYAVMLVICRVPSSSRWRSRRCNSSVACFGRTSGATSWFGAASLLVWRRCVAESDASPAGAPCQPGHHEKCPPGSCPSRQQLATNLGSSACCTHLAAHLHVRAQEIEADTSWLLTSTADARSARRVLIAAKYPQLVTAFENK